MYAMCIERGEEEDCCQTGLLLAESGSKSFSSSIVITFFYWLCYSASFVMSVCLSVCRFSFVGVLCVCVCVYVCVCDCMSVHVCWCFVFVCVKHLSL